MARLGLAKAGAFAFGVTSTTSSFSVSTLAPTDLRPNQRKTHPVRRSKTSDKNKTVARTNSHGASST